MTLAALFGYINYRYIKLPTTIGVMLIALLCSIGLIILSKFGMHLEDRVETLLKSVDFSDTLMHGMLSFLLFAGALHVNLADLARQKWTIGSLATLSVVVSTLVVGFSSWAVLGWLGVDLPMIYCLLFGALISPTDPIAVLGVLKTARAPKSLETKITGESLFNDGVGVVVFIVLLDIAKGGHDVSVGDIALLFAEEAIGGIVFGLVIGSFAYRLLKNVDNYQVEILITLALVTGGYALAGVIHVSGPIAIVIAGLLIGNHGRLMAMSDTTREHLDTFWELVDEIMNAILFVLIGLEVLVLTFTEQYLIAALVLIPLVLAARFVSVALPISVFGRFRRFTPGTIKIMTWGGLRGGISVALALSLPTGPEREAVLTMTYAIVVFSILVQGLTIEKLIRANRV